MITRIGTYSQVKGVSVSSPCLVATTGPITLSNTQTIDGVSVSVGDRVLVKNQSTGSDNGIYVVSVGAWDRAVDMSLDDDVFQGLQVYINSGTTTGDKVFILNTPNPIVLGTTNLNFVISVASVGTSGTSGTSGSSGTTGTSGTSGTTGTSGSSGTEGTSGTSGTTGTSGSSGTSGTSGSSGTTGTSGSSATSGTSGSSATSGTSGTTGTSGSSATSGTSGTTGTSGSSATSGTSGSSATSGTSGTTGTSGTSGTSVAVSGTQNTVVKFTSSTTIGNSQIFDNGTNIGIGTVIPVAKLSIEGTGSTYSTPASSNVPGIYIYNTTENTSANTFLALRTTGAGGGDPILSWDIGGVIGWSAGIDNSDGDKFKISNSWSDLTSLTRFTIDGSGNVGIGTVSPAAELQVGKSSDVTIAMSNSSSVTSGNRGSIAWYNSSVSSVATIRAVAVTDNVGTELQFFTRPASGSLTQVFTLSSTGAATFSNTVRATSTGVDGTFADALIAQYSVTNAETNAIQTSVSGSANLSGFRFQVSNGGGSSSRTTVVDFLRDRQIFYGNVGIGINSPTTKLNVEGAAIQGQGLLKVSNTHAGGGVYYPASIIRNTRGDHSYGIVSEFSIGSVGGTDRPSVLFYSDAVASSWTIGQVTAAWGIADSFGIGYRANNSPSTFNSWPTNYFAITTGGNVLIGTTTDSGYKLDVNGSIRAGNVTNYLTNTSTGTNPVYQRILNTGGDVIFGIASSTGGSLLPDVGNYATVLYNNTATDISFGTNQIKRLTIASGGNVLPGSNGTQDLGSSTLSWANIYTNDLHLSNETKEGGNDIDGTTGSWTIQEGLENLYLINNKNNKRYFIKLQEIL